MQQSADSAASKTNAGSGGSYVVVSSKSEIYFEQLEERMAQPDADILAASAGLEAVAQGRAENTTDKTSGISSGKGVRFSGAVTHTQPSLTNLTPINSTLRPSLGIAGGQKRATLAETVADGGIQTATALNARHPSLVSLKAESAAPQASGHSLAWPRLRSMLAEAKNALLTLAYAPAVKPELSLFNHVLVEPRRSFAPPLGPEDRSWAARPLPNSAFERKEQACLANGIYFEARGEQEEGQAAVAQVIFNRLRSQAFPDKICGVVYQNLSWKNRCQFSFACDRIADRVTDRRAYATAMRIGHEATNGETWLPRVGSATNYHATYVNPSWAQKMKRVDKIGRHIFYRTFGEG